MSAAPTLAPPSDPLEQLAAGFAVASQSALERLSLQRRFDRKFLLPRPLVAELLAGVQHEYLVVLAGARRLAVYDTVYYDTPALQCFHDHRRRRRPRVKVRVRHYHDRALSMLEVKQKTVRGETRKERWPLAYGHEALGPSECALLRGVCPRAVDVDALAPQARTVFRRLTLIGVHSAERVTLDFGVSFERQGTRRVLEELVVVEVKDEGRAHASALVTALRRHRARNRTVSKYCAAIALLETSARVNAFLPALRAIEGGLR